MEPNGIIDEVEILSQEKGYIFLTGNNNENFYIMKPIYNKTILPKGVKRLSKPNFSYFPSIQSIVSYKEEDERLIGLPNTNIALMDKNNNFQDAELLAFDKGVNLRVAELVYSTFVVAEEMTQSMFEVVKEFENIFGLVWKIKKKVQVGLMGELLVMQHNQEHIEVLLNGFHGESIPSKSFESMTDFDIETYKGLQTIEVKTSTKSEGLFDIKNNQLNENINDYVAAVTIELVKKGGQTLIDLLDWYLTLPTLNSNLKKCFEDLRNSYDDREILRFDPEKVRIKFIDRSLLPRINVEDERIKNVTFQIDLNHFDGIELSKIINGI